jgi:hypothetical protein
MGSGGITLTDSSCLLEWACEGEYRQTPGAMRFANERGTQLIAFDDAEMSDWLLKIAENPPGHFLRALWEAVSKATDEDYFIIRPALMGPEAQVFPAQARIGKCPKFWRAKEQTGLTTGGKRWP